MQLVLIASPARKATEEDNDLFHRCTLIMQYCLDIEKLCMTSEVLISSATSNKMQRSKGQS